jgi:ribosomal protein L7Ae-like RNA K-turn-binding protein
VKDNFLQFLSITKKSGYLIEGYNKCIETFKKSKVYLLILSKNCSDNTKDKFIGYCNKLNIPYIEFYGSEELGDAVGRPEINVLCITDKNMSEKLISLNEMFKNNRG